MTEQKNAPKETAAKETTGGIKGGGLIDDKKPVKSVPLWLVCLSVGFGAALYFGDIVKTQRGQKNPPVVVLDTMSLVRAKAAKSSQSLKDPVALAREGAEFAVQLKAAVADYTADGIVVLHATQAVSWPHSLDVTPDVAKKIGVDLNAIEVGKPVALLQQFVVPARPAPITNNQVSPEAEANEIVVPSGSPRP